MKRYFYFFVVLFLVACTGNPSPIEPTNTPEVTVTTVATTIAEAAPSLVLPTGQPIVTPTAASITNVTETPFTTGFLLFFWDTETPLEDPSAWSIPAGEPKQDLYVAIPGSNPTDWQLHSLLRHRLEWPDQAPNWPSLSISPDRTKIAFQIQWFSDFGQLAYSNSIYIYNWVEGIIKEVVPETTLEIFSLDWMPDNHTLAYIQGNELYQVNLLTNDAPQPLTNPFPTQLSWLSWSPQEEIVAITFPLLPEKLVLFDNLNGVQTPVIVNEQPSLPSTISWSLTGEWLATNLSGDTGLMLFNPHLARSVTLVSTGFSAHTWSPNGSQLAFTQSEGSLSSVFVWDTATGVTTTVIDGEVGGISALVWSPDNRNIFLGQHQEGIVWVSTIEVSANKRQNLLQLSSIYDFTALAWSPDGQWLLFYVAKEDNTSGFYIVDVLGNNMTRVLDTTNTLKPLGVAWIFGDSPLIPHD